MPSRPPSFAGAAIPDTARIDEVGVVRWFPPGVGLGAFRIQVRDGVVGTPGRQAIVVDVREPDAAIATDPITCRGGSQILDQRTQFVPAPYDILRPNDPTVLGLAYAMVAEGREASCFPSTSNLVGVRLNTVTRCRTIDALSRRTRAASRSTSRSPSRCPPRTNSAASATSRRTSPTKEASTLR